MKKVVGSILIVIILIVSIQYESNPHSKSSSHEETTTVSAVYPLCPDPNDVTQAYHESLEFFDDVTAPTWALLKQKVREMGDNTNGDPGDGDKTTRGFYQEHYEPNFVCTLARRLGGWDANGKWVCDPHRIKKQKKCLVYSIGSKTDLNYDFAFETSLLEEVAPRCEIHVFGYGSLSVGEDLPDGITGHPFAIGGYTVGPERALVAGKKTLQKAVKELGHESRTIDVLKIDCDGCEFRDYLSWFDADVTFRQVIVTLHHGERMDRSTTRDFFTAMAKKGYVIFHKEPIFTQWKQGDRNIDYGFLKLNRTFFDVTATTT